MLTNKEVGRDLRKATAAFAADPLLWHRGTFAGFRTGKGEVYDRTIREPDVNCYCTLGMMGKLQTDDFFKYIGKVPGPVFDKIIARNDMSPDVTTAITVLNQYADELDAIL